MSNTEAGGQNRRRKSQQAFKVALCRLLTEKPLRAVRVKEICALADYSHMAFYSNYPDKYALAEAVMEDEAEFVAGCVCDLMRLMAAEGCENRDEAVPECLARFFRHAQENPEIYRCITRQLLLPDDLLPFSNRTAVHVRRYVRMDYNQSENGLQSRIDEYFDWWLKLLMLELSLMVRFWLERGCDVPAGEVAHLCVVSRSKWIGSVTDNGDGTYVLHRR